MMGNHGFIAPKGAKVGIHLHWHGGRDSIEGFLKYAELSGLRGLGRVDASNSGLEGLPGFMTILINFFGNSGLNAHLNPTDPLYPELSLTVDNGVYVIDGFEIVERHNNNFGEQRAYTLEEMLREIDNKQPARDRLGAFLNGVEIPTSELKIGDQVFLPRRYSDDKSAGRFKLYTVLGIGDNPDKWVNGRKVFGVPYIDMFDDQENSQNCNSYIRSETVRVFRTEEAGK